MISELHITYDDATGNVNVNGPVGNKGLCYLMLECARDAVKDNVDAAQRAAAQPVAATASATGQARRNGLLGRVGRRKRG